MNPTFFDLTRDARRILIIDPGVLGDVIHALPGYWELRRNHPTAEIHAIASPSGEQVLRLARCVDRIWTLEQSGERRTLRAQLRVLSQLRRLRFDASINFSDNDRNVFHAVFIGGRHRLGLRGNRWHFWSPWLIPHWLSRDKRDLPVYQQRLRFLAQAGYSIDPTPRFGLEIPADAQAWARLQSPGDSVHLSISASSPYKEWSIGQWAGLVRLLLAKDLPIVATSSDTPREVQRLKELEQQVTPDTVRFFPGGLDIPKLAAILGQSRLHVGADSGAIHLAMALGIPTVGIYRDYSGRIEWTPSASPNRQIVRKCHCEGGLRTECQAAGLGLCLAAITPEEVMSQGVEPLLAAG
ncbi:MAG TPA: glycosyltransferase family 9 protein [Candidatus Limnocylindria bacterium]|nr:glycosyltransferase family 9 protein [Candidatus Limnocylindria bacterium]